VDGEEPAFAVADALQVPVVLDHVAPLARDELEPRDRDGVAPAARREQKRARIARPDRRPEDRVVLVWRDVDLLAVDEVDEMEVVVAGVLGQPEDAEPAAVGGEPADLAVAAGGEHASLLARLEHADVDVQVAPVAAVARIGEPGAARVERRGLVEELGLDDQRLGRRARCRVEEVELRALVPTRVDREQNAVASRDEPAVHRLAEVGQLDELLAGTGEVQLEAARYVPPDEHGSVVPDVGREAPGDLEELLERRHGAGGYLTAGAGPPRAPRRRSCSGSCSRAGSWA
jgi:hypothetical protein